MSQKTKYIIAAAFVIMIAANALANLLPLNHLTTGQVSDIYPNLFAPAPLTFSIWGVIYLLLALHILYLFRVFGGPKLVDPQVLEKAGLLFALSSLFNAAWIFAWHYLQIPLSMVLMAAILLCLIAITGLFARAGLRGKDWLLLMLPFSVYFGWITVATIANTTVLLVSLGWNGFGLSPQVWMVLVLLAGTFIGTGTTLRRRDAAYTLVLIWAYAGILIKHLSAAGFQGAYPVVYITAIVCMVLFAAAAGAILFRWEPRRS